MNKKTKLILGIIALVVVAFLLGPRVDNPVYNLELPAEIKSPQEAEDLLLMIDKKAGEIKPDNESRLIWANDSTKGKTPYCMLYIHGYSACPEEGNPVHVNFAKHFGMNAVIPRMAEHGLVTEEPLLHMTPDIMWESAKQSLMIARALGEKVVLIGTSTGGSLALKLVSEYPEDIEALYLYSPNVRIFNKAAPVLTLPWGLQIGRLITGGKYRIIDNPKTDPYWYNKQRGEGLVNLQKLIKSSMKEEVFEKVSVPVFLAYFYKNEDYQDKTVSVEAIKWMYGELGTPQNLKRTVVLPEAGDHVICCHLTSNSWEKLQDESIKFAEEILKLEPEN